MNKEDLELNKGRRNGMIEKKRYEEDSEDSDDDMIEMSRKRQRSDGGKEKRKCYEDNAGGKRKRKCYEDNGRKEKTCYEDSEEDDDNNKTISKHSNNKEVCILIVYCKFILIIYQLPLE